MNEKQTPGLPAGINHNAYVHAEEEIGANTNWTSWDLWKES